MRYFYQNVALYQWLVLAISFHRIYHCLVIYKEFLRVKRFFTECHELKPSVFAYIELILNQYKSLPVSCSKFLNTDSQTFL